MKLIVLQFRQKPSGNETDSSARRHERLRPLKQLFVVDAIASIIRRAV